MGVLMSHFHAADSLQNRKFHLEKSEPLQASAWNVRGASVAASVSSLLQMLPNALTARQIL